MADGLTDIAIVGMAGRFPGARDIAEFWRNLCEGRESIRFFTMEELADEESRALARQPSYVGARAIIDDVEQFDAPFFGIYPREAERIDPQQRIFLECCWYAFEDAGYDPLTYEGVTGVYAGCSPNTYFLKQVCWNQKLISRYSAGYQVSDFVTTLGTNADFLTTRVAYKLGLKGPAFSLNCGCSTSLVAVAQACLALQNYQIDMALAGGVSITFPQRRGYLYEPGGMVSSDGHCRTFDESADGTVFGDGAAVVLLKRLEDALADGDHIYALIKGFGITNDASAKVGFTAPGVEGQARAIAMAHAVAGVEARSISYIEAHGTGTPLGDPIEIAALTRAFRRSTPDRGFCAIGTAKTNIGHVDIAAGATGLIKTALSLHHRLLPPVLHFRRPNPRLDLENSPFYVNMRLTTWQRGDTPLRAGVSAFGIGGTNAHVVLEEAPKVAFDSTLRDAHLLVLSAKTDQALDALTDTLVARLAANPAPVLADVAHTLMVGGHSFAKRRYVVVNDSLEAAAALAYRDPSKVKTGSCKLERLDVAFMFPGQGAQYVGMGRQLCAIDAEFRADVERTISILKATVGLDLGAVLYSDREAQAGCIDDTSFAQPAIFAIEYALARFWIRVGIQPVAMIGHSVGELVAACLGGVFSLDQAIRLIGERGRLMQALPHGAMLSIALGEDDVAPILDEGLSIAAINGPSVTVVAGPENVVAQLEDRLSKERVVCRRLRTSHAFHSAMMDPVRKPFAEMVRRITPGPSKIPFISGVTGSWITDAEATDPEYWARHLREPVRFASGIRELRSRGYALLELGPGRALSVLARQQPAKKPDQIVVASMPQRTGQQTEGAALLDALGQLWLNGAHPDWSLVYSGEKRLRVSLPPYPFERSRCWIDAETGDLSGHSALVAVHQQTTSNQAELTTEIQGTVHESSIRQSGDRETIVLPARATEAGMRDMRSEQVLTRLQQIRLLLEGMFKDLSGIDVSAAAGSTTFLEMGFDSLFLTQVAQWLQSKFALKITFRQLLDQLCTVDLLAEHIDKNLAPNTLGDFAGCSSPVESPPAVAAHAAASADIAQSAPTALGSLSPVPTDGGEGPIDASASLQSLFKTQLQTMSDLMSKQLEALQSAASVKRTSAAAKPATASIPPVVAASAIPRSVSNANEPRPQPRKFLPFSPVETHANARLSPVQQQHLHALIERYTRKTIGSKRLTEAQRGQLADPRVVAGFRIEWKELVYPIVTVRSKGSKLWDVDGNEYIDLVNGYGPIMFGHTPDFVTRAVAAQLECGYETGPQSLLAGEVANLICKMTRMQRVTFCNTGSEAVVAALRVARTITGRNKVVMFTGAYHGMFDEVVVKGVSGPDGPRSLPVAPGIPREHVANVVVLDYGSPEALSYIESHASELAAVLVEPVQSRHPERRPVEFLRHIRRITEQAGAALIFDEVVTGFRVHQGGCQAVFGIKADLATYGKVLAGGLPIGILAGRGAFMDALDGGAWNYGDDSFPEIGVTFFAGTFVRHPLALAAALAVLKHLEQAGPALQDRLAERTSRMASKINEFLAGLQVPTRVESFSSFAQFTFPAELKYAPLFYWYMRERGVYIQEGFPIFLTTAHSDEDLERVVSAFKQSVIEMQASGFLPAPLATPAVLDGNWNQPPVYANGSDPHTLIREEVARGAQTAAAYEKVTAPVTRRAALTESQLEIWLSASLGDEASCAYNESFTIKLWGHLEIPALLEAIDRLINRHEALRATFSPEGDFQEFATELRIAVPVEDLSDLDESNRAARMSGLIATDARLPFDLVAGPLLRAKLIRIASDEHHLLFTSHHIVCDGWSTNILIDELSKLYNALSSGSECELPTPMGFGEYAKLQSEHFSGAGGAANESYWVEQFKLQPAPLELPLDHPRPAIKTFNGGTFRRVIPVETYRRIKQFAASNKCTLFVALLSGFQALLSRLSGQKDIVVGIPAAGQSLLDNDTLVGQCVNFLPLRGRLEDDPDVTAYLSQVKATLLDAYDHQNYTYGRLIRTISITRDPSRLPLVEVQFNLERVGEGIEFRGLQAEIDPNSKAFVNHDLFLNVIEREQGLILDCDYNTDLFDLDTIERWLGHYQTLLEGMAAKASQRMSRQPLLSDAESQRLIVQWNDTRSEYPRELCVHQLFEEQVRRTPQTTAIVYGDDHYSYAELNAKAEQLARYLRGAGVSHGSLVGIFVDRSLEMVVALLGVLKAGAAYVPMDPTYPAERVAYVLNDANIAVLLTQSELGRTLPATSSRLVCLDTEWDKIEQAESTELEVSVGPEDLAYIIYTSGSTGKPKGVEIPHRAVVNLLWSTRKNPGVKSSDILLAVTTLSFDIAALEVFLPLCVGARVVIASRASAADGSLLLKLLKDCAATVIQATPITFRLLIEAGWTGRIPLKILCGGEALSRDLANQLIERGESVWNMYGPTETTVWSSTIQVEPGEGPVPIGPPIANTQFYVLDPDGKLVPIGQPGELHIGGDGLARGYFRRPELSAERFIADRFSDESNGRIYKTGDLVRRLANGNFEFLGRLDNQIKLRGFRIELGEIETALSRYPGVREAIVALREDAPGDKRLVAYIVTDQQALTLRALREFLTGKLPNYMLPSAVVRLEVLPLTATGKVSRNALPAPDNTRDVRAGQYSAPTTQRERLLADIWADVLRIEQVGTTDNLFELGADSLHIFQIAARASKAGIKIAPARFLKYRTIQEVLQHLEESSDQTNATQTMPAIVRVSREKYRVTRMRSGKGVS